MEDPSITITLNMFLSLWTGLILLGLSVIAYFAGSLPDNPPSLTGNVMRLIVWSLLATWLFTRIVM